MLRITVIEQLLSFTLEVPALIEAFASSDPDFSSNVAGWLQKSGQVLAANSLPAAGELAVLRGSIFAVARGVYPVDLMVTGQPSTRKLRNATAFNALRKGEEIVRTTIRPLAIQIGSAETRIRQVIAIARERQILSAAGDEDAIIAWSRVTADQQLRPLAAEAVDLVGRENALILFARLLHAPEASLV
jgi:hypothetical protein